MDLVDRVALITGASGGLGAVTARALGDRGVHVAVTHLGHRDEAVELCGQIEAKGRRSFLVHPTRPTLLPVMLQSRQRLMRSVALTS